MRRVTDSYSRTRDILWTAVGILLITAIIFLHRHLAGSGIAQWTQQHWLLVLCIFAITIVCSLMTSLDFSLITQIYAVCAVFFLNIGHLQTELLLVAIIIITSASLYFMKRKIVLLLHERNEHELQLRNALDELKRTGELKDEVIFVASHDLRTPLSIIKLNLATIKEGYAGKVNKEALSYVDAAYRSAERLGDILEDLLEASVLENTDTLELKPVQLEEIIRSVVASQREALKHLAVTLPAKPYKSKVYADPLMARRVIENLIINSAKYTQQGTLSIAVEEHGSTIRCVIKDTGIGIPQDAQRKLFTKFYRAPNALTLQTRGSGLGLYITKQAVQRMHGTISVHSEVDKGSTFSFDLPKVAA